MENPKADIAVRTAAAEDAEVWGTLSRGLFAEDSGTRDALSNQDWPRVAGPERFRINLADPEALILLAEVDGEVAGGLSGRFYEPSEFCLGTKANINSLYVLPAYRSHAVGSALVGAFKVWAAQRKAQRLTVTAYAENERALRFYRRNGFGDFEITLAIDVE
jgi:GNAT superfamily N-acetyltransferase